MKLAISGANGYLGKLLSNHFASKGYQVFKLSSKSEDNNHYFNLTDSNKLPKLKNLDALIIFSYSKNYHDLNSSLKLNRDGTIRLIQVAQKKGIKNIIYVSSMSAFEGCKSIYGQTKLEIEKFCIHNKVKVIKPGLVYSQETPGGTFAALIKFANFSPILPKFPTSAFQYLVHEKDLCQDIETLLNNELITLPNYSCYPHPINFNNLLEKFSKFNFKLFIPVHMKLVIFMLKLFEYIGLKIGPGSDSLIGLCSPYPFKVPKYKDSYLVDYSSFIKE